MVIEGWKVKPLQRVIIIGATVALSAFATAEPQKLSAPATPSLANAGDTFTEADRLFKTEKFAAAANQFAAFVKVKPKDERAPTAWFREGLCLAKLNRGDNALHCWDWIAQRYPDSAEAPDALEQSMALLQKKGNQREAKALADKLVLLHPTLPAAVRVLVARAEGAMGSRRYDEAIKLLAPVEAVLSPPQRRQLELARLFEAAKSDTAKLIEAADAAFTTNDPGKAVPILEQFLAILPGSPQTPEARVKLGWACYCLHDAKNLDHAESLWEEVIRKGPPADFWVQESQWHIIQLLVGPRGKWKEGVARCEAVAKNSPVGGHRHEQALYTRAWILWAQNQWAASLGAFQDLVKAYPQKASHPPILAYMKKCENNLVNGKKAGQ